MKNRMAFIALFFALVSLLNIRYAFAGAWTVPKDHVWGEYYMKWDYSKTTFNTDGKQRQLPDTNANTARSWEFVQEQKMEFGATDWLTAMFGLEWKESHYKEYDRFDDWGPYERKNNGLTNIKLGARWRLTDKPAVISLQGRFFIYPGYGVSHGDDDPGFQNQPSIGYGDTDFELRGMIGKTFNLPIKYKIPCYVGAESGYRWRNQHVCSDIPYFIEGGFWPAAWLLIKSELDGYWVNPATGSIKSEYGIWRIGFVYQVFGDSVLRKGEKMFNIECEYGVMLWGKNVTDTQEWVLKVQTQF